MYLYSTYPTPSVYISCIRPIWAMLDIRALHGSSKELLDWYLTLRTWLILIDWSHYICPCCTTEDWGWIWLWHIRFCTALQAYQSKNFFSTTTLVHARSSGLKLQKYHTRANIWRCCKSNKLMHYHLTLLWPSSLILLKLFWMFIGIIIDCFF